MAAADCSLDVGNLVFKTSVGGAGAVAATEKMRITSAGFVGIGTTTPNRKLHVESSGVIADFKSTTTQGLVDIIGTSNQLRIGTFSGVVGLAYGTGTSPHITIASGGNVGIGTTSPAARLTVKGTGTTTDTALNVTNSADASRLLVLDNGNIGISVASAFGNGVKVIGISNATTVPNADPSGGGVLYVEAGALKYRGSSGTITTIAPA